jgi:hypothetical protein
VQDDQFTVLNAIYLRKLASSQVLTECTGMPGPAATGIADDLAGSGLVVDVGQQSYMLTDEGTQAVLTEYGARYAALRGQPEVEAWYDRFETVNGQFLQTLSAWQTGKDEAQLSRLLRLVERHVKALGTLVSSVPRYERYADRLDTALQRVDEGDIAFVTSPTVDSVHNVWFEFHEDILTVLGRPRDVAEAAAGR